MTPGDSAGSFSTERPVAILMVFLAAVVFGALSYGRLPVTLMPELSYPTVTVRTTYPGAAPEEVESDISRPIEEALGVVGGLQRISSISRSGVSDVVLEFSWDTAMSDAVQDTLEKLDLVNLPEDAKRPLIMRFDPSLDPVLELSLRSEREGVDDAIELRRVRRLAETQVKRALEPVPGVAAVRIKGGLEEEIHVDLDAGKLARSGLSVDGVVERLRKENINVAGGTLKEGRAEYMVRTLNEYESIEQMAETVVAIRDGRPIHLKDVGSVERSHAERTVITRTEGVESVQIEIFKEADANIVALAQRVRAVLGREPPDETPGEGSGETKKRSNLGSPTMGLAGALSANEQASLTLVSDRSTFIESSIREVRNTAVFGGLLAILVLYFFLRNFKSTAIIAVAIPVSLVVAFAPLNVLGVSLNIMSLGGLALGIGMLVDSSIVVLESIHRCRQEGDGVKAATVRGTREVRGAVGASILTSIAVFLPVVFVEGIAGQAFGDLGLAVVVSLLGSLAVALYLIPMLASLQFSFEARGSAGGLSLPSLGQVRSDFKDGSVKRRILLAPYFVLRFVLSFLFELAGAVARLLVMGVTLLVVKAIVPVVRVLFRWLSFVPEWLIGRLVGAVSAAYPPVLRWALRSPALIVVATLACFVLTARLAGSLDNELLPEVHQGTFSVELALPVGTPLQQTDSILTPVEAAILEEREHIQSLIVTLGTDPATSQRSDEGEHSARFTIILEPSDDPEASERAVTARVRRRLASVPDLQARIVRPVLFSFKAPIEVEVHGEDLPRLRTLAERVKTEMELMPELADVETTQRPGAPEVQIVYDRERLMRYGLNIRAVAQQVRSEVKGAVATRMNLDERRVPVVVRMSMEDRQSTADIEEIVVNPGGERPIALNSVASIHLGEGPSEVRRIDAHRAALVQASIADGSLGTAVAEMRTRLRERIDWPRDMSFLISGQNREWERSKGSLLLALSLSIFLVYVIMASQFESLLHPLVIMFTIPLAFLGTVLTLKALSVSVSIVVLLGMIMLAGIVVNNAIVLVDYINELRRRGMGLLEAVEQAGTVRLRPILMTTSTTVLGLLPMALGLGDGAEIRTPMALTVISGLISSTALTLVVVPVLYSLLERMRGSVMGEDEAEGSGAAAERVPEQGGLLDGPGSPGVSPT